ncbi:MAG: hypothetical protein R3A52_25825 [Polyangiales bacterium]
MHAVAALERGPEVAGEEARDEGALGGVARAAAEDLQGLARGRGRAVEGELLVGHARVDDGGGDGEGAVRGLVEEGLGDDPGDAVEGAVGVAGRGELGGGLAQGLGRQGGFGHRGAHPSEGVRERQPPLGRSQAHSGTATT